MGSQTVQMIRQRRVVCCNSANRGTASTDFTHHEWHPKESTDGPSSALQCKHETNVELCEEAKKTVEDNNMCAKLRMSMYGTKAAAQNWQKKVQEAMATLGFSICKASPVLFCHPQRSLKSLVHGDDFVVSGEPVDLVWMRNELESKLEINTTILGDEPGMSMEVKILNRKLCWHDGVGISYEADRKHADNHPRNRSIKFDVFENHHVQKRIRRKCETKQTTLWRRGNWESWARRNSH